MTKKEFDMTDNRFYIKNKRTIKDSHKCITENGYVFSYKSDAEEVCNLLNNQNAKIKSLKREVKILEDKSNKQKELNIPKEQIDEVVLDGQLRVIAIYYKKENPIVEENKKRLARIFLRELKEGLRDDVE